MPITSELFCHTKFPPCHPSEKMFDAIRSLMQDLTYSGIYAVNDKILTSSENLRIEVVTMTSMDLLKKEGFQVILLLTLHTLQIEAKCHSHLPFIFRTSKFSPCSVRAPLPAYTEPSLSTLAWK